MLKPRVDNDAMARSAGRFAALGDGTRLAIVERLAGGTAQSIASLTAGTDLTRQAISKHLAVLEHAGMVRHRRSGRQTLYALEPGPVAELHAVLDRISRLWDERLARLKSLIEDAPN